MLMRPLPGQAQPTASLSGNARPARLLLLFQRFRCLQVVLQRWQRLFRKIGEWALRLRLFLVLPDVLMIADHLFHKLIIEFGSGKLAEPIVHGFLSRIGLLRRGDTKLLRLTTGKDQKFRPGEKDRSAHVFCLGAASKLLIWRKL
jgi:hypothetical protein